jgi:hypothetical protein
MYRIHGTRANAMAAMKSLSKMCIEIGQKTIGFEIHEKIFEEVFEDDNYAYNPEIVTDHIGFLVEEEEYAGAIESSKKFIKFIHAEKKWPHLIQRARLGIVGLNLLMRDI